MRSLQPMYDNDGYIYPHSAATFDRLLGRLHLLLHASCNFSRVGYAMRIFYNFFFWNITICANHLGEIIIKYASLIRFDFCASTLNVGAKMATTCEHLCGCAAFLFLPLTPFGSFVRPLLYSHLLPLSWPLLRRLRKHFPSSSWRYLVHFGLRSAEQFQCSSQNNYISTQNRSVSVQKIAKRRQIAMGTYHPHILPMGARASN